MDADSMILSFPDRIGVELCSLYRSFGYVQYKMSKFEEYDLYARNKDFLISDAVLTFTDLSGRLMALKPDVTLSIVRNTRDDAGGAQKVYYTENVYRADKGGNSFREILQAGLECIGEIDDYQICETLILAAKSLERISERSSLVISHLDVLSAAVDRLGLPEVCRAKVLRLISDKNLHELAALCAANGADAAAEAALMRILETAGDAEAALTVLEGSGFAPAAAAQLRTAIGALRSAGFDRRVRIDLSVVSDMTYYNGVVFKGYVDGVPVSVLSGGQYDRLMRKMGRRSDAVGFAVYLDALERLYAQPQSFNVDLVLLYDDAADPLTLCGAVRELTAGGRSVSAQKRVPEKLRYRQLARLEGNEVVLLEDNA